MTFEEAAIKVAIILIPTIILCLTAFYMMRMYVDVLSDSLKSRPKQTGSRGSNEIQTRLRLQASERFVLYLERITPHRLVMRLNRAGMSTKMLHNEIIKSIREEFEHNLSQQIYVSEGAWKLVQNANEETKKLINLCAEKVPEDANSYELGKHIFEVCAQIEKLPSEIALEYLRKETNELMR